MNYPFRSATLDYLHGADVTAVADALMQICEHYPAPALNCAMNFLSTHDTERAITAIAGEPCNNRDRYWQSKRCIPSGLMDAAIRRLLLGYAMIFTLPGVPCVYYGDEIAMQGYRDPFNRAFLTGLHRAAAGAARSRRWPPCAAAATPLTAGGSRSSVPRGIFSTTAASALSRRRRSS